VAISLNLLVYKYKCGDFMVRTPVAIGFYPGNRGTLLEEIKTCFLHEYGPKKLPSEDKIKVKKIFGGVAPHAGYIFSGPIAANLYYKIATEIPRGTIILLGPSHMYPINGAATVRNEPWATPLGEVKINDEVVMKLLSSSDNIFENKYAHKNEHSLEVQLPFLQFIYGNDFKIVPIAIGGHDFDILQDIGYTISDIIKDIKDDILIIASSDFTHYGVGYGYAPVGSGPISKILEWMYEKDKQAINHILNLDERGFLNFVEENQMTICGYAPITVQIIIAKRFNIKKPHLLKYATSWDTNQTYRSSSQIVGYAAISFEYE